MTTTEERALLLEALSDKVLHQLPPAVWKELFLGPDGASIRFEERHLTLVHVDVDVPAGEPGGVTRRFHEQLQRLSQQHNGRLDPYVNAAALAAFEDPGAALRMALELQRAAQGVALRIGVATGPCTLAYFRVQGRLWCTPLGARPQHAAEVAATARVGGIVIAPETSEPAQHVRSGDPDTPDFADSEMNLCSLGCAALDDRSSGPIDIRC